MERKRPFPTFVLWLLVFALSLLFLLVRFSGLFAPKEPPTITVMAKTPSDITVTSGDVQLNWVVAKNHWNGSAYDREGTFICYELEVGLPAQLEPGSEISIRMGGDLPDSVTLEEYALTSNERSAYGNSELLEELSHFFFSSGTKTGSFFLPEAGDHPLRGYLLTCAWGENVCEYGIVVQIVE